MSGEEESGIIRLFASLVKIFPQTLHITRGRKSTSFFIAGKVRVKEYKRYKLEKRW